MKRAGGAKAGSKPAGNKGKLYTLAEPMPAGMIVEDATKKKWRLGKSVGVGGFGQIYMVSDDITKNVVEKSSSYVMKIEPYTNGPIFVEQAFYSRCGKPEQVAKWKSDRKISSLGMPCFVAHGCHEFNSVRYRFLILDRFGQDLHRIIQSKSVKRLSCRSVQAIALQILDTLEYIHSTGYTHADIKASNLLLGRDKKEQLYLVDYGLATRFRDSEDRHIPYGPDLRQAHNGTLEYLSRDAHIGAFGRRGDLEILGYNMIEWLCGKLPWSKSDPPAVIHKQKIAFMNSPQLKKIYTSDIQGLDVLEKYLKYVAEMPFEEEPNYTHCRELLKKDLPNKLTSLYLDDTIESPKKKRQPTKAKSLESLDEVDVIRKKIKVPEDESAQKRATRTTKKVTKNFNWTNVLSSNPEMIIRSASQTSGSHSPPDPKSISPVTGPMTPAMLQILAKKKENVYHHPFPLPSKGHHHSPIRHVPIPPPVAVFDGTPKLTPAMQEVLMSCKNSTKKKLRKSFSLTSIPKATTSGSVLNTQVNSITKHVISIPKVPIFKPYVKPKPQAAAASTFTSPKPPIPMIPKTIVPPLVNGIGNDGGMFSSRQARYNLRNNIN